MVKKFEYRSTIVSISKSRGVMSGKRIIWVTANLENNGQCCIGIAVRGSHSRMMTKAFVGKELVYHHSFLSFAAQPLVGDNGLFDSLFNPE